MLIRNISVFNNGLYNLFDQGLLGKLKGVDRNAGYRNKDFKKTGVP